ISFQDVDHESKTIRDFKGKYVVIALWSKETESSQAVFREPADRHYWYRDLAFASVNVDFNEEAWEDYVKEHKESYNLQEYWLNGGAAFVQEAQIRKLPHYILVDDKGFIYDFNAPAPGKPEFNAL